MKKLLLFVGIVFSCIFCLNTPLDGQVDLYLNNLNVYVSEYGRVAVYSLPDTIRQNYRTALLVGTGPNAVFDLINDVEIEEPTQLLVDPTYGDYEIYGSYNNNYSSAPPNVLEKENVYCWNNQTSFIVKYTIINREASSIDAIVGLEFLPRIEDSRSGGDTVTYSTQSKIISVKNIKAVGFKPLSEDLKSLSTFYYYTDYEVDTTFYNRLTYNSFDSFFITDPNDPNVDAPALIPAFNSKTIAAGDSMIYYIAIAYGINETEMLANMQLSQQKYSTITSVETDITSIPSKYLLEQNYPNPFNPSTKIAYQLPQSGFVTLKVYNTLGKEVATLVNEEKSAGRYSIDFNAANLSTGVYFYKLTANGFTQINKMLLIK